MNCALLLAGLLGALAAAPAGAQHLPPQQVPAQATTAFARTFPAATGVKWQQENTAYLASYEQPAPGTAVFTAAGVLVETRTTISDHRLPPLARTYMGQQFPHREVDKIMRIVDAAGTVTYAAQVCRGKDKDCQTSYFDENGRLLTPGRLAGQ
jgi:hypothetical protein